MKTGTDRSEAARKAWATRRANAVAELEPETLPEPDLTESEVIYGYSRAQAIEDGILADVSEMGREAGFKWPVALTGTVWGKYVEVPVGLEGLQDIQGRLWDILYMARVAARKQAESCSAMTFQLHVRNDDKDRIPPLVTLKMMVGPGDDGAPVVTIMLPSED